MRASGVPRSGRLLKALFYLEFFEGETVEGARFWENAFSR
jgi:hypothetical protein